MNDENKRKTLEEKFFAECHELQEISGNKDEWLKTFLKAFKALDLRIGEEGDIHNEKYLIPKGSEGYDEMKEIIETLKKTEMNDEQKSYTLTDLFIEEYRELKEENKRLKREVEELKEDDCKENDETK